MSEADMTGRRGFLKAGAAIGAGMGVLSLQMLASNAHGQGGRARTLIVASHPYPDRSIVNKALWEAAQKTEGGHFRNLESAYGDNLRVFDRIAERRLYEHMERLVLMFPTHWFNLTPMLKAYLNEIWGAGPPPELRGKELLVVTTTGGDASAYTHEGRLGFTIQEVLTPLRASAKYAGMTFSEPLVFFGASGSAEALRGYQGALAARLRVAPTRT